MAVVEADSRLPFFWTDCKKKQSLRVRILLEDGEMSHWSGSIDVLDTQVNMISFCVRSQKDPAVLRFMKLDIREDEQLIYFVLHECTTDDEAVYIIENKLKDADLFISQKD